MSRNYTKTIRLIGSFYRSFFLLSFLITATCLVILWENGLSVFAGVFWLKIGTLALTCYFINGYKSKEFYYYYNHGLSRWLLWAITLSFDFLLFLSFIIITYKLR